MTGVLIKRGNVDEGSITGKRCEDTGEDRCLQAEERGLRRNRPCNICCPSIWDVQPPERERIHFCRLSPQSGGPRDTPGT